MQFSEVIILTRIKYRKLIFFSIALSFSSTYIPRLMKFCLIKLQNEFKICRFYGEWPHWHTLFY